MTPEQWIIAVLGIVFGSGGIAALFGVFVTRKLGIKTHENEANRDMNTTWDAIVENLQTQIDTNTKQFTEQLKELHGEINLLKSGHKDLEERLSVKERLVLKAIAFINRCEAKILKLGGEIDPRPEGLE